MYKVTTNEKEIYNLDKLEYSTKQPGHLILTRTEICEVIISLLDVESIEEIAPLERQLTPNQEQFFTIYKAQLQRGCELKKYDWPAHNVDEVYDRMVKAVFRGTAAKDGYAFKQTCKILGIPHTYKAMSKFLSINWK